jgi:nitroimidazol reductase NimA-like FMN-containing flavoprotein (pyridoxamine 5'-phosphate oxidase superfamily)
MLEMPSQEVEELLCQSLIGRLSMADLSDGRPYTIPLPFCWANAAIYIWLPMSGRKGQVLAGNDRVCFRDRFVHRYAR